MMLHFWRCKRAGFTLIEIMIVIAIIAILAAIAIPNVREARAEAQLAACRQNILQIVKALEMAAVRCSYDKLVTKMGGSGGRVMGYIRSDTNIGAYLIENGYLRGELLCPTGTSYFVYISDEVGKGSGRQSGLRVACGGSVQSTAKHHVGGKCIQPVYYLQNGDQAVFASARPDGAGGCGWGDYVEDDT